MTLRDQIKQMTRDELGVSGSASQYLLGTIQTINADGSVVVLGSDGVSYTAGVLYPVVQGQQCILTFGDGGKIAAIPTSPAAPQTEVIHPPFLSGGGFIRLACYEGNWRNPAAPFQGKSIMVEDTRVANKVFILDSGITDPDFTGFFAEGAAFPRFSPNGRFMSVTGVDATGTNSFMVVYDLGVGPIASTSVLGPNPEVLDQNVVLCTMKTTIFKLIVQGPADVGAFSSVPLDLIVTDDGTMYWLVIYGFLDSTSIVVMYKFKKGEHGDLPQQLGSYFIPSTFTPPQMNWFQIWDGPSQQLIAVRVTSSDSKLGIAVFPNDNDFLVSLPPLPISALGVSATVETEKYKSTVQAIIQPPSQFAALWTQKKNPDGTLGPIETQEDDSLLLVNGLPILLSTTASPNTNIFANAIDEDIYPPIGSQVLKFQKSSGDVGNLALVPNAFVKVAKNSTEPTLPNFNNFVLDALGFETGFIEVGA